MNFKKYHVSRNLIVYPYYDKSGTISNVSWTVSEDGHIKGVGTTSSGTNFFLNRDGFLKAGTYTIKIYGKHTGMTFRIYDIVKQTSIVAIPSSSTDGFRTFTLDSDTSNECRVYFNADGAGQNVDIDCDIMLNEGSEALPYEPYSSEVWHDTSYYIHKTDTDTLTTLPAVLYPNATTATVGLKGQAIQSGTPTPDSPIMPQGTGERTGQLIDYMQSESGGIDGSGNYVWANNLWRSTAYTPIDETLQYFVSWTANTNLNVVRINYYTSDKTHISREQINTSGTALTIPQNAAYLKWTLYAKTNFIIDLSFVQSLQLMINTGSTALPFEPYGYKIPISSAGQTTPVYLGDVESTRRIKKLVLDGTEDWTYSESGGKKRVFVRGFDRAQIALALCSHFDNTDFVSYPDSGKFAVNAISTNQSMIFGITDMPISSATDWKSYLAQQYAAGTPVCAWYALAEPETGIVSEPLMKIGDYADTLSNISIPVTAGGDTLSVGTTVQPSEVTVNYKGWHPVADVHEKSKNLFDYQNMSDGGNGYLRDDGTFTSSSDWKITKYIPCDGNSFVINPIGGNTPAICLYDSDKNYITGKAYNTGGTAIKQAVVISTETTAHFIRFTYKIDSGADNLSELMLNLGSEALPYEPYWK